MNKKLYVLVAFLAALSFVLSACTQTHSPVPTVMPTFVAPAAPGNPSAASAPADLAPGATSASAQPKVVTFTPPDNAVPLISNDETIGFFFVLNKGGPVEVKSPYQSTTLFALGNGEVGDTKVTSDGTEGNIVALLCNEPEGCVRKVDGYSLGNVGVTIILAGKEKPVDTVLGAVVNMFSAPNCGQSGCNTVYLWQNGQKQTFADKPSTVQVNIPWTQITVQTAMVGEPPANAKVIKIGTEVVGHQYVISGANTVSVPEGTGGTILCFPKGGTANGEKILPGEGKVFTGMPSDNSTPKDLNQTVLVTGDDVQVTTIYLSDLSAFSICK